jgi:DNA-binding beta-propeller fold protein YncE
MSAGQIDRKAHVSPRRLAVAVIAVLALAPATALAARNAYVADGDAGKVAQLAVAADGGLSPLLGSPLRASSPRRLTMAPDGTSLYATAGGHGRGVVLQYDVGPDGGATPKIPATLAAGELPSAIAADPTGRALYVADKGAGYVFQFPIGGGGRLASPTTLKLAGPPAGLAVAPDGRSAYVIVGSWIKRFAVGAGGVLDPDSIDPVRTGGELTDIALTPDGRRLYASSADARIFGFDVAHDGTLNAHEPTGPAAGCTKLTAIAIAPDGEALYAVSDSQAENGRRLVQYDIGANGVLTAQAPAGLPLEGHPSDLAVTPNGRSLYVAAEDLQLFDLDASGLPSPKPPAVGFADAVGVVVSPNQAPVASFEVSIAPAGSAVSFDARSATDPDGSITRYDWDFGDGNALPDGGPRVSHVYARPGVYEARLVVTDNEGASTRTVFTGSSVLGNGAPTAATTRLVQILAPALPVAPAPRVTPVAPAQPPRPELGETIIVEPAGGRVRVRLPGTTSFVALRSLRVLPVGSLVDTRRGKALLSSVRDRSGSVQQARFFGGLFQVRQRRSTRFVTDLVLRGRLASCPARDRASASARRRTRKLWGNGRGRFRTRGRYSSGAVRGTRWLVSDSCAGTLTVVRRGRVAVRDFTRDQTIVLEAGERYLARPG